MGEITVKDIERAVNGIDWEKVADHIDRNAVNWLEGRVNHEYIRRLVWSEVYAVLEPVAARLKLVKK